MSVECTAGDPGTLRSWGATVREEELAAKLNQHRYPQQAHQDSKHEPQPGKKQR